MGILEQEMKRLAQAGGSHKTVHDRIKLAQRFCERLVLAQNVQIRRVEQLKARHIEGYIRERLAQGITKRSLQNEMAAVRCILKQAGRDRLAQSERLNNRSLGLSAHPQRYEAAITPEYYRRCAGDGPCKRSGAGGSAGALKADGAAFAGGGAERTVAENVAQALERGELAEPWCSAPKAGDPAKRLFLMLSLSEKRWIMR
jgi:hypothetical protein